MYYVQVPYMYMYQGTSASATLRRQLGHKCHYRHHLSNILLNKHSSNCVWYVVEQCGVVQWGMYVYVCVCACAC